VRDAHWCWVCVRPAVSVRVGSASVAGGRGRLGTDGLSSWVPKRRVGGVKRAVRDSRERVGVVLDVGLAGTGGRRDQRLGDIDAS